MLKNRTSKKWVMGLDIGTTSVAVACYAVDGDNHENHQLEFLDSVIFSEPVEAKTLAMLNQARRAKRLARRQTIRKARVRRKLLHIGKTMGLSEQQLSRRDANDFNVLDLRLKSVNQKLELQDVMLVALNMLQNRGARHNRLSENDTETQAEILQTRRTEATKNNQREEWSVIYRDGEKEKENELARFASRQRYEQEVKHFLETQEKYHAILKDTYKNAPEPEKGKLFKTREANKPFTFKDALEEVLTYQKPIKWDTDTIGKCELMGGDYFRAVKAQPDFQFFRIEQKIQDMQWRSGKPVTPEQKNIIRDMLFDNLFVKYTAIYERLDLVDSQDRLTHDSGEGGGFDGDKTNHLIAELARTDTPLLTDWNNLSPDERAMVIAFLGDLQDKTLAKDDSYINNYFAKNLAKDHSFKTNLPDGRAPEKVKNFIYTIANHKKFDTLSAMGFDKKRAQYSLAALRALTKEMKENNCTLHDARAKLFPNPIEFEEPLTNPLVRKSYDQTMRMVQHAIKQMKKRGANPLPEDIRFEMMRELQMSVYARTELNKKQGDNRKVRDQAKKLLAAGGQPTNATNIKKYQLWEMQGKACAYSGNAISLSQFTSCDIDHIRPQSKGGSDAFTNLVLVFTEVNQNKGDMTPYQAYKSGKLNAKEWNGLVNLAKELINDSNIFGEWEKDYQAKESNTAVIKKKKSGKEKKPRLTPQQIKGIRLLSLGDPQMRKYDDDDTRAFQNTSYVAKTVKRGLLKLYKKQFPNATNAELAPKIIPLRGSITALARQEWGFENILPHLRMAEGKPLFNADNQIISPDDFKKYPETKEDDHKFFKRCDHRHHIIDAATIGLITRSMLDRASTHTARYGSLYIDKKIREENKVEKFLLKSENIAKVIYPQLQSYMKNYVVWHKPDRFADGQFFEETAYRKIKENSIKNNDNFQQNHVVKRILLTSLIAKYSSYAKFIEKIEEDCEGYEIKKSIITQLQKHEKNGKELKDALGDLWFPEHTKNLVKKISIVFKNSFNAKYDIYIEKNKAIYFKNEFAVVEINQDNELLFIPHWQLTKEKNKILQKNNKAFYKNDFVYSQTYNDFYVIKGYHNEKGIRILLATEAWCPQTQYNNGYDVKIKPRANYIKKGITLIPDRQTLAQYIKIKNERAHDKT